MSFSNNDGVKDLHLSIHRGIIDYQKIVNTIVETAWKGVIAFEVRDKSFHQNIHDLNKLFENAIRYHKQPNLQETL